MNPVERIMATSLLGTVLAGAAQAACEESIPVSRLAQQISQADAAFADMDDMAFNVARTQIMQWLPCVDGGLTATQAAALYRLQALGAFLDRDHAGAVAAFRSLLRVAPGYALPDTLAPEGHPLRLYFDIAAGLPAAPDAPLSEARTGWVHIDGQASKGVPVDRPYLFQYFDQNGSLAKTVLVAPGVAPPDYPAATAKASHAFAVNVPLAVTAGVAAVAAGGLYVAAANQESLFWDAGTPKADLAALRSRANTLGTLSAGVGVFAVGTGVAAVFVGQW